MTSATNRDKSLKLTMECRERALRVPPFIQPLALVKRRKPFYFQAKIEKSACAAQLGVLLLREDDDIAGAADREIDIAKLRKMCVE
jgi:hypothetical protein